MWEIPVNIRYNFSTDAKTNWFALLGSSSYFMKSEKYDYQYERYGSVSERYTEYSNHPKSWFAVLNIGGGYERKLGGKTAIRIEPYVKLPVKGLGWGRLPITSTGINVGYTRSIF